MLKELIFPVYFVLFVSADGQNEQNSSSNEEEAPLFSNMNEEELEAAEALWASYKDLKSVHEKFQSALELSQTMFDEVIGTNSKKTNSRFMTARSHLHNPVDVEKIRRGNYATQQPRTPPEMKVRIFDGVDEEKREEEATEEAQQALAARIRDGIDEEMEEMSREGQEARRDNSVSIATDSVLASVAAAAAAAAAPTPTEEINEEIRPRPNLRIPSPIPPPQHLAGTLPCPPSSSSFPSFSSSPSSFSFPSPSSFPSSSFLPSSSPSSFNKPSLGFRQPSSNGPIDFAAIQHAPTAAAAAATPAAAEETIEAADATREEGATPPPPPPAAIEAAAAAAAATPAEAESTPDDETMAVLSPYKSSVSPLIKKYAKKNIIKEKGIPNGYYGPSRGF